MVVAAAARRRGLGVLLTEARLTRIAAVSDEGWYVANERNLASIDLHARCGFRPVSRDFVLPGVTFEGRDGVLFRIDLAARVSR